MKLPVKEKARNPIDKYIAMLPMIMNRVNFGLEALKCLLK